MHAKTTWVLVADAAHARIFVYVPSTVGMVPVDGAHFENPAAHGHTSDLGRDRPARSFESVGGARHAQEPRVDLHRQAKMEFARRIADFVEDQAEGMKFERLVLVAPPQMLGDLRSALGKQTARRVVGEIHKDLTKLPASEIAARVQSTIRL